MLYNPILAAFYLLTSVTSIGLALLTLIFAFCGIYKSFVTAFRIWLFVFVVNLLVILWCAELNFQHLRSLVLETSVLATQFGQTVAISIAVFVRRGFEKRRITGR